MIRKSSLSLTAATVLALSSSTVFAESQMESRLFVTDHAKPVLTAIDASSRTVIDTFDLKSPATVYATQSGETVFAVQRDGNLVQAFSSGISVGDHGDHGDLTVSAPALLDADIAGERPVHFVDHNGQIALFFDGDGVARIVSEASLTDGNPAIRKVASPAPHHGLAIAWGDQTILSEPNAQDPSESPIGVRVLDATGEAGPLVACPGLHGEAASGNMVAIACQSGLLILRPGADGSSIEHVDYSDGLPADTKVSTLVGGRGLQYLLGNFGQSAVVLIDPVEENPFRLIDLPTRRVHFAVDPVRAKFAYVFTEDGQLHRINVLSGSIDASLKLTEPYSMDGHWSDPRPRIAVTAGAIAVTDPLASTIHLIDPVDFKSSGEIAVDGAPFNIVAVEGSGAVHE